MLLLLGCIATTNYTERTLNDGLAAGADGEFYIMVNERDCTRYSGYGSAPIDDCDDTEAKILQCTRPKGASGPWDTTCEVVLTSDQAFVFAARTTPAPSSTIVPDSAFCARMTSYKARSVSEEAMLLAVKNETTIDAKEFDCLVEAGLPTPVLDAARAKVAK